MEVVYTKQKQKGWKNVGSICDTMLKQDVLFNKKKRRKKSLHLCILEEKFQGLE